VLPRMLKMYEDVMSRKPAVMRMDIQSGGGEEMVTRSVKLKAPKSPFLG